MPLPRSGLIGAAGLRPPGPGAAPEAERKARAPRHTVRDVSGLARRQHESCRAASAQRSAFFGRTMAGAAETCCCCWLAKENLGSLSSLGVESFDRGVGFWKRGVSTTMGFFFLRRARGVDPVYHDSNSWNNSVDT
jgi:hypothetical protein